MATDESKGTCFVVMGFGKKTDFETGRTLDLDKTYKNMVKPAVESAGLKCIRADEIVHSGLIDVPMYEQLLNADVVVADLSTSNKNAFYELGIRHALRPFATVIICEDGIKSFPFDVNHVAIRQYHHLGEDIGFDEVIRFRGELKTAIEHILEKNPRDNDSPVYSYLKNLNPPALAATVQDALQKSATNISAAPPEAAAPSRNDADQETHSMLMQQVDEAQKSGDWTTAKKLLEIVRNRQLKNSKREDPYILQKLALATYKSKQPNEKDALKEAWQLLQPLDPLTSNDAETLGLTGAIHKRLWQLLKEEKDLDAAVKAYERGFFLRRDYYNGINFAFLLNLRASEFSNSAEAIADFVLARRARSEVIDICNEWFKNNPQPASQDPAVMKEYKSNKYWVMATLAEAYAGLGEDKKAQEILQQAYADAPETWMEASTKQQIETLQGLLKNSPLQQLKV